MRGGSGGEGQTSEAESGVPGGLGVVEQPENKHPSTNIQAPEKFQAPNFKVKFGPVIGAWSLVFLWSLDVGAWRFSSLLWRLDVGAWSFSLAAVLLEFSFTVSKKPLAPEREPMRLALLASEIQVVLVIITHINRGFADNIFNRGPERSQQLI